MRLSVLGGSGHVPPPDGACGGYLLEVDEFSLLIDPGQGVLSQLHCHSSGTVLDAIMITNGGDDHGGDLQDLLLCRDFFASAQDGPAVYAPTGSLDDLLDLGKLRAAGIRPELVPIAGGQSLTLGPLMINTVLLPCEVPSLGLRITAGDTVLAYTSTSGECSARVRLAEGADVLLAESSYLDRLPNSEQHYRCSARQVARHALRAGVGLTIMTHLCPDQQAAEAIAVARSEGLQLVEVARPGLIIDVATRQLVPQPRRSAGFWSGTPDPVSAQPRRAVAGPTGSQGGS